MQFGTGSDQFMSDINVTPFVDVMLVLLIIFMVTAPMMVQGVNVDLPKATAKALKSNEEQLIVSVDIDGKVFINEQPVKVAGLTPKLRAILEHFENKNVYLRADKKVPYGIVVNVISKIKQAGVDSLGMITLPDDEKEES
ncbi:MAG: protein TolR [Desulfobacteraceae bacterium]|mgnify:CR=1 FL=1|nr:MAG: protein TolR [Desulfobacteraceae bacterium]